jgi:hypothetical protein
MVASSPAFKIESPFSEIDRFVMAITAAKARPWHVPRHQMARATVLSLMHGRPQMRKTTLFAFSPALIAIGFGVWAASPTANMPVSPSIGEGIEPFQMMVSAKEMPAVEIADYTFVFAH